MTAKIQQYFNQMKNIEGNLLSFIEECNQDKNTFINFLDEQQITKNKSVLKSFLYLIVHISNNYHRTKDFYAKIDQILTYLKDSILQNFQNSEIFHIFQSNKRILLFLIQQKLFTIDQSIVDCFNQPKFLKKSYIEYFFPEVEAFLPKSVKDQIKESNNDSLEQFNEKRQNGENDSYICSLIRNDQVVDFIAHLEKNNISPSSTIKQSIYETNQFLNKNGKISLIEYSAFFGAQQIFVYLNKKNVDLTTNIWPFVIHGKNADLIHFLEENHVQTLSDSYQYLIIEAIKCHHNDIADYFKLNFCQKEKLYYQYLLKKCLKYYNFNFEQSNAQQVITYSSKSDLFLFLCKYDYNFVIEVLLSTSEIDINQQYKIYKPSKKQTDIVLSIAIKNGEIDKIPKDRSSMWFHISDKDLEKVEYKDGENYYAYNYDLEIITPLLIAVRKGNIDSIQLLLNSSKINIEIKSKKYFKKSYSSYCDEFYRIEEERTLFHEAVESGYINCVQFLLSLDSVNIDDNLYRLKKYIDRGSTAHMYEREEEHMTVLVLIAELGYSEIMRLLLSRRNDRINEKSVKVELISGGCISYSETVDRIEITPLHAAILNRNSNIVKICLENPNIDINIPFITYSLNKWSHDGFKSFFQKKENDKIKTQSSVLYLAVSNYNVDIVRLLLNQPKIDINMKSTLKPNRYDDLVQSKTALHEAVKSEQIEIINLLLQQPKIDINALDENHKKPIDYTNDEKIIELFKKIQK